MMSADAEKQEAKSLDTNPTDEKTQTKTQEVQQVRYDQMIDMVMGSSSTTNSAPPSDPTAHDASSETPDPAASKPAPAAQPIPTASSPAASSVPDLTPPTPTPASAPAQAPAAVSSAVSAPTGSGSVVETSIPVKAPGTGPIVAEPEAPKTGTGPIVADPISPAASAPVTKEGQTSVLNEPDFEEGVPKWGTAQFTKRKHLILTIDDTQEIFVFNAEEITEITLGRFDPTTNTAPDVDLLKFGGGEKGVSRKHAVIIRRDGALSVVDHNSGNGTYLNGQKLVANQPRILRNGDDLRLGNLKLRVSFVQR